MGRPMRGVRAVMVCLVAVLALSGFMYAASRAAVAQPQGDLDAMAYGSPYATAPVPVAYAAAPMPAALDTSYKFDGLAALIAAKLRNGYIRDPSVAVEIESYRPFFILGEVAALTHTDGSDSMRVVVPLGTAVSPGDTVLVGERWF